VGVDEVGQVVERGEMRWWGEVRGTTGGWDKDGRGERAKGGRGICSVGVRYGGRRGDCWGVVGGRDEGLWSGVGVGLGRV